MELAFGFRLRRSPSVECSSEGLMAASLGRSPESASGGGFTRPCLSSRGWGCFGRAKHSSILSETLRTLRIVRRCPLPSRSALRVQRRGDEGIHAPRVNRRISDDLELDLEVGIAVLERTRRVSNSYRTTPIDRCRSGDRRAGATESARGSYTQGFPFPCPSW